MKRNSIHILSYRRQAFIASRRVVSKIIRLQVPTLNACYSTMTAKIAEYGTWISPITSHLATEKTVRFAPADLTVDSKGVVFWNESRPSEKGRSVVCSWSSEEGPITTWTPEGFNARTRVNEYGGGAFFTTPKGIVFSNFSDQRLYLQSDPNSAPKPLTPENCEYCFAAGVYSKKLNKILCVCEDHSAVTKGKSKEAETTIISIDLDTQEQNILVSGADFYGGPQLSPNEECIAWTQWDHPNMPWDDTEIWKAKLEKDGKALTPDSLTKVAGGKDINAFLPSWSPDGKLYYVSDKTNWWNLYEHKEDGSAVSVDPKTQEVASPHWVFGRNSYDFHPSVHGRIVLNYGQEVGILDRDKQSYKKLNIEPLHGSSSLAFSPDGSVFIVAGGPYTFTCIVKIDPETEKIMTIHESSQAVIDNSYISEAKHVQFPTSNNQVAYGNLYLPKNKDYVAPEGTLPPLLVRAHGGPTSQASTLLDLKHQYLTSRGFAIFDVDYRGSTGYGRQYRDLLKPWWGVHDVEDVCNGALYLVQQKLVDKNRLAIDGGSAGGLTTLAALTFKDVFHAGVSFYGVSDLEALLADTHKFESNYTINLVGPYPDAKSTYVERSPINHADKLNTPMAFFQGGEDKVVPPEQSERMFEVVKNKGLPTAYVFYPTEQHGFREAENVRATMEGELYFLAKIFKFEAPNISISMEIHNLPEMK